MLAYKSNVTLRLWAHHAVGVSNTFFAEINLAR